GVSPAPTRTVCPSLPASLPSLPSNGEGISAFTLSVTTSTNGSSRLTKSPSCLSHLSTVPSVTDSPSWGILICDTPMSASVPEGCVSAKLAASGLPFWLLAVPPTRPDRPCDTRHDRSAPSHNLISAVGGL